MVAGIFKDRVLAAAGENEHGVAELQSWTQMRKGRFSLDMDDSVTHLLCTDEQFKNSNRNKRSTSQVFISLSISSWPGPFLLRVTNSPRLPIVWVKY